MRNIPGPLPAAAVLIAYLGLTIMDALIKDLTGRFHVGHIVALRYWFGAVIVLPFFWRAAAPRITVSILRQSAARAVLITFAAACFFTALSIIPLGQATALGFTSPLFVVLFAGAILKEPITPTVVVSLFLGLAGVVVMVWRDLVHMQLGGSSVLGAGLVLAAAFGYAMVMVLTRLHSVKAEVGVMVFCQTITAGLFTLPVLYLTWTPMTWVDLLVFALVGAIGSLSHLGLAWAFSRANAARLGPLEYSVLPWAVLFGYLFFAEVPQIETLIGALMIVSACFLVLARQSVRAVPGKTR